MKIKFLTTVLVSIFSLSGISKANAQFKLTFYGNNYPSVTAVFCDGCNLSTIGQDAVYGVVYNMRDYPYNKAQPALGTLNDKFKSIRFNAKKGNVIRIFNNADGDYSKGSCIITVKKDVTDYYLNSFEATYENEWIKVQWWSEQNGLNGQVSSFKVDEN